MLTILGATGFVGRHLAARLQADGRMFQAPPRGDSSIFDPAADLGDVIYCIGMTADFRSRPYDTVDAHIGALKRVLQECRFRSLTYLSSTRVYRGAAAAEEDAPLRVDPNDPSDLYNLTKLTGEALCLAHGNPAVRVVRLSNVYGHDPGSQNFLPSLIADALERGAIHLGLSRDSAKDYVSVADVATILPRVAATGRRRLYNIACGVNVTNGALLDGLAALTGCSTSIAPQAPTVCFPAIATERLRAEFDWRPRSVLNDLPELVAAAQTAGLSRP